MQQINLTHAAFDRAKADVDSGADRLQTDRNNIDQRVTGFLTSGWTGTAASAFVDAWEEWKVAADEVRDGLRSASQLLDAAHRDFIQADDGSQQQLDALSARLIDRLGG